MKAAIFGATSQIAKDLIMSFAHHTDYKCVLFVRDPAIVDDWLNKVDIHKDYRISDYTGFSADDSYDVIINFVGVGNPSQAKEMGSSILDITYLYDTMVL
ncbi:MAG: NAD(P)-dependent oxidoreductase, partial [Mariprofundaceae bacterium]|nr:NAD(P)-dependent oxidoreductase [Mariprofundaceae bacterium]